MHTILRWGPALVALLAFLLRVIHLLSERQSPLFDTLGLDAKFYDRWASTIAAGDWLGRDAFFMGPLYPYFLAVLYRIFGATVFQVTIVQAGIDAATCALIFLTARRIWGREREGALAGILACFYGPMMLYAGEILYPTLGMFLNTLFLYLVIRSEESDRGWVLLLAGIVLGLSALGKATALAFYPAVVGWWLLRRPRPTFTSLLRPAAVLLVGVVVTVLPITARNRIVGGDWVLITSNAGLNFYIGNNASSSGAYLRPPRLDVNLDPTGQGIAEAAWGRSLKPSEVSTYWFSEARHFLESHPGQFASLFLKKMAFFWGALEIPQIENFNFEKRYSPLLNLPFPSFGWVVPLAVVGVILGGVRSRWAALPMGLAVVYSLAISVFFVTARYRMAVVPHLLIVSAGGILCLVEGVRAWRRGVVGLGVCVALAAASHWNPYHVDPESGFAEFEYRLGLGYEKAGDIGRAENHYRKALGYEPFHPHARLNLGIVCSRTGRAEEGRALLESLARRRPEDAKAHFNLGLVLVDLGEFEAAREAFARAVAADTDYVRAWHAFAVECYRAGDLAEAEEALRAVLSLGETGVHDAWMWRSRFLLQKLEKWESARAGKDPAAGVLRQGDILVMSDNLSEAYDRYVQAGDEGRIPEAYYEAGTVAYNLDQFARAIEALERCVALDPRFPGAHFLMGSAYAKLEDFDAALKANEIERELSPDMADVYFRLGLLYENHTKDIEAALDAYETYLRLGGSRTAIVRDRIANLRLQLPQ